MAKTKKRVIEYRNYDLSPSFPAMVLSGPQWQISDVKSNRLHFHNCLEIGICHSDSGYMEIENQPMPFAAGDVTVVSRNIPHTTYSAPGQSSLWSYLFLQPERLIPSYLRQSLQDTQPLVEIEQYSFHIFRRNEYPEIHFYASRIAHDLERKPANYQANVRALCTAFMVELMRIHSVSPLYDKDKAAENALTLAPALDYVQDNYHQQFPIDMLAELCGLSPTHFRRVFQQIMRCRPLEFLHRARIAQAQNLLRGTERSILEISEHVGYLSLSSFNRHFLRETGVSPSDWRRKSAAPPKQNIEMYTGWMLPERPKNE